jgi:hypothetical protein
MWLAFSLDKQNQRRNDPRAREEGVKLQLKINPHWNIDVQTLWQETSTVPMEHMIQDIAVGFVVAAEASYRAHLKWQEDHEKRLEQERRKRELEEQQQQQRESVRCLFREARAWRIATDIRAYVHAVSEAHRTARSQLSDSAIQKWSSWALDAADRLDPTTSAATRVSSMRAFCGSEFRRDNGDLAQEPVAGACG